MTKDLQTSELAALAKQINEAHHEVEASFGHSLQHAIVAGEKLEMAKASLPHGEWMPWHEKHIRHSLDTTDNYRNLAANKALIMENSERVRNLGYRSVLRLLKSGSPMLQSLSNEWYTPRKYTDAAREVMGGIDLDPASCAEANRKYVGATDFYDEARNGLDEANDWYGRVFLNPPYGKFGPAFIERLSGELASGGIEQAVVLVNCNSADAGWFQPLFDGVMCFVAGRIEFESPDPKATSSTHGSCFVYFGPNEEKFAAVFAQFGNVVKRWP